MELKDLLIMIQKNPKAIRFEEVIEVINAQYKYTPTEFNNGDTNNAAGTNEGSCKIFSFALLNNLDKQQTLNCFGTYYREDVLQNPKGEDHANIRNFIKHGWEGISFNSPALVAK